VTRFGSGSLGTPAPIPETRTLGAQGHLVRPLQVSHPLLQELPRADSGLSSTISRRSDPIPVPSTDATIDQHRPSGFEDADVDGVGARFHSYCTRPSYTEDDILFKIDHGPTGITAPLPDQEIPPLYLDTPDADELMFDLSEDDCSEDIGAYDEDEGAEDEDEDEDDIQPASNPVSSHTCTPMHHLISNITAQPCNFRLFTLLHAQAAEAVRCLLLRHAQWYLDQGHVHKGSLSEDKHAQLDLDIRGLTAYFDSQLNGFRERLDALPVSDSLNEVRRHLARYREGLGELDDAVSAYFSALERARDVGCGSLPTTGE